MGKYDPLRRFLRRRGREVDELVLSFDEIERILGALLPKAAREEDWWGNSAETGRGFVQRAAWLEAGYEAEPIVGRETVRFRPKGCRSGTSPSWVSFWSKAYKPP